MGRAYWAKSSVMTRLTGIPYRQNDITLSKQSGRILIRAKAVRQLELDERRFVLLRMPDKDGRLIIEIWLDGQGVMGQHLKRIRKRGREKKDEQENMQAYARGMVRIWCTRERVEELRLEVVGVMQVSEKMTLVEVKRVEDICEMYHFKTRKKPCKGSL